MRKLLFICILLISTGALGQNELLAKNYFDKGEYEKALTMFERLYKKNKGRTDYLLKMIEANQQLERFDVVETLLSERLSQRSAPPQLHVEQGYNFALQGKDSLALVSYNNAKQYIEQRPMYGYNVGSAFSKYSLLDEAASVYERAMELDPERDFNAQLARIYGEQGKLEKMFVKYIDLMQSNPRYQSTAQRNFSLYITEDATSEPNTIFRKVLLSRLQKQPELLYNELLSWLFVQQKDYKKAFTQEKAIYKRQEEEDLRGIVDIAVIAIADKAYDEARDIMNFVVENSPTPPAKLQGYSYLMKIELATATPSEYSEIEQQFEAIFATYGKGKETYVLQIEYNHFLAFNNGKKEEAIANLKTLADKGLTTFQKARVKMELSDILVFDEKFNQALIYYSQIQESVKNDKIAQEARFKVARTSYYKGDFPWAQLQLDVLRKSASQLIANDAMQLSLMIRDNSLEDSTQTALKKYAKADLLALQNKNREAVTQLDDILTNHKGESIEDEALLKQAELFEKSREFQKAEVNYNKIIELYKEDILADDAHFRLAKLYEEQLDQQDKAKELYEQIIYNFADSIFFVEARKRFRMLRGDAIN